MVYPPYGHKVDLVSMSYYFVVLFVEELGFSLKLKKNWKNPRWLQLSLKSFKTVSDQAGQFWLKGLQPCQT